MAKVLGLGGVFFKAKDPAALMEWYRRVLGLEVQDWGVQFARADRGYGVWAPFKADTDYFAPSPHGFMINLMVDDLDGMLAMAKKEGVEPLGRMEDDANGRFAWVLDPEGIKVELWQPPA
jgi:predicted enzyme related to lactoylglutathione lyase